MDGRLPRILIPVRLQRGEVVGEQHQFGNALQVLKQVGVELGGLAAYADALQRLGILEEVLTELLGRLWQDDGLDGLAVLEQVGGHEIVLLDFLVDEVAVVAVVSIFLDVCIPQVKVFQSSVRPVTVVGIGTCHMTDDSKVSAVKRTADGQRVVLGIGALNVAYLVLLLHQRQTEAVGKLTHSGDSHYLVDSRNTIYDIVGILAPGSLVVGSLAGRHVYLQTVVLVECARADGGRLVSQYADGVQLRAAGKGIVANGGNALRQLYLLQHGAVLEGFLADVGDGGRQQDVTHIRTALEPRLAHVVEPYALEVPEVAKRIDFFMLCLEFAVEP